MCLQLVQSYLTGIAALMSIIALMTSCTLLGFKFIFFIFFILMISRTHRRCNFVLSFALSVEASLQKFETIFKTFKTKKKVAKKYQINSPTVFQFMDNKKQNFCESWEWFNSTNLPLR